MAIDKPDFELLKWATGPLIEEFSAQGVTRVEYVVAFMEPYEFWVWLCTTSDDERDALLADKGRLMDVAPVLKSIGLQNPDLLDGVTVQSQETVDREYEGRWFYALR